MLRQAGQFIQMLLRDFLRFVWMDSDRGINPIVLFGERQRGIDFLRARASADRKQSRHSSSARAVKDGFSVFRELREVDVRVGID